jgi:hypothetical protein
MKKLLLFGALAFGLNTFGQYATYYFDIAPGHVSLQITQLGPVYTVVNLDEFCQGFQANFLLNGEYSQSQKWSSDEHNVIEYSEQEDQLGVTAYISKQTNDLEKIKIYDDSGVGFGEESCLMGGEYSVRAVRGLQDVKTVKIGNLEVMTEDLGEMTWDEAVKACAYLGDGWRLPTKDELNFLYENVDFAYTLYWSSTEDDSIMAWAQNFSDGNQYNTSRKTPWSVRAVRAF